MIGVQASHLSEVLNGKRALTTDLSAQTQYELESANAVTSSKEKETIAITIPVTEIFCVK